MNSEERINQFNQNNRPFYIIDYENGKFGLCLPLDFLAGDYKDFRQEAFDRYAMGIGDPVMDSLGIYTHGSGYEWQIVFQKAFEDDPDSSKIEYDCEAGGFFCRATSLDLLEKFGAHFRAICMDEEKFAELVDAALKENREQQDLQEIGWIWGEKMC